MYNNELYHFGVKGMKWGVRKDKGGHKGKKPLTKEQKKEMRKKGVQTATAVLGGHISGLALKHLVSKTDLGLYRGTQTASYILGSWLGGAYVHSLYEGD